MPDVSRILFSPVSQSAKQSLQMDDDTIFMGDLAYDYLVREAASSSQWFPHWVCHSLPFEDTYGGVDPLSPASSFSSHATSPRTMCVSNPIHSAKPTEVSQECHSPLLVSLAVTFPNFVHPRTSSGIPRTITYPRTELPESLSGVQQHPGEVEL